MGNIQIVTAGDTYYDVAARVDRYAETDEPVRGNQDVDFVRGGLATVLRRIAKDVGGEVTMPDGQESQHPLWLTVGRKSLGVGEWRMPLGDIDDHAGYGVVEYERLPEPYAQSVTVPEQDGRWDVTGRECFVPAGGLSVVGLRKAITSLVSE